MSADTVDAAFMTDRKRKTEKKFIKIKQGKGVMMCLCWTLGYPLIVFLIFVLICGFIKWIQDLKREWTY